MCNTVTSPDQSIASMDWISAVLTESGLDLTTAVRPVWTAVLDGPFRVCHPFPVPDRRIAVALPYPNKSSIKIDIF
jgi:hypothetical protein